MCEAASFESQSGGWQEVDRVDYGNRDNIFLSAEIEAYDALNDLFREHRGVHIG